MSPSEYWAQEGWIEIGRLSKIPVSDERNNTFLQAVLEFQQLKVHNQIPADGYPMPDLGEISVGRIIDVELIPITSDNKVTVRSKADDSVLVVKPFVPEA